MSYLYKIRDDGKWEFFVDNHTLQTWQICPTKFHYKCVPENWDGEPPKVGVVTPRSRMPWRMSLGIWWAEVIQDYYEALRLQKLSKSLVIRSACDRWESNKMDDYLALDPKAYEKFGGGASTPVVLGGERVKVPYGAIRMAMQYFDFYNQIDQSQWTVLATEAGFGLSKEVLLEETNSTVVYYTGRPDLVVLSKKSDCVEGIDHKTVDSIDGKYVNRWKPNNQFPGYVFSINKMLYSQGLPVKVKNRFIINVAARNEPDPNGLSKGPRKGLVIPRFKRVLLEFSDSEIEEWKRETVRRCYDIRSAIEFKDFERRTTSCHDQWGGNCEYLSICEVPPENRLMQIKTLYNIAEPWTPYKVESNEV